MKAEHGLSAKSRTVLAQFPSFEQAFTVRGFVARLPVSRGPVFGSTTVLYCIVSWRERTFLQPANYADQRMEGMLDDNFEGSSLTKHSLPELSNVVFTIGTLLGIYRGEVAV